MNGSGTSRVSAWLPWLLLAGQLGWCAVMVFTRRFNADEYEHLHASWYVLNGAVPYADFFEHHHPLLWFLLAPLVAIAPESFDVLTWGRIVMWGFHVASALTLMWIGRRTSGPVAGLWAGVLWTALTPVQNASVEIRPDVPMTFCLLLAYLLALDRRDASQFGAGAAFGVGLLLLQKAVLFFPALILVPLFRPAGDFRQVVRRLGWMAFGVSVPLVLGAAYLVMTDSLQDWWNWSVRFNTTAPPMVGNWYEIGFRPLKEAALKTNTLPLLALVFGAWVLIRRGTARESLQLVGGAILLLGTLALTRRPYDQYLLPVMTLPALVGGVGIATVLGKLRDPRAALLVVFVLVGTIAFQNHPRPWGLERFLYKGRVQQRERFEHVLARTTPDDIVFQGYPPFSIHRADATFFWFLPFDLSVRGRKLGLFHDWSFRDTILAKRPAYLSIGTARTYPSEDTFALHHDWLIGEAGYTFLPELQLYARDAPTAVPSAR